MTLFSFAMGQTRHLFRVYKEPMSLKANSSIVVTIVQLKLFVVNAEKLKFILSCETVKIFEKNR